MARVTKNPETPKKLNGELSGAKVVQPKKKRGKLFSCLAIVVAVIVLGMIALGWVIAATGLVNIPVISRFAYEEPEPIRYVSAGTPLESYIETSLQNQIADRVRAGGGELQDMSLELVIPETSFTTSFRNALTEQSEADMMFEMKNAQVAFDEERKLEFFFPLKDNEQNSALRLYLVPSVQDGDLKINATDMYLGSLRIPGPLTELFVDQSLQKNTETIADAIRTYVALKEIDVRDKNMLIRGDISAEIFRLQ